MKRDQLILKAHERNPFGVAGSPSGGNQRQQHAARRAVLASLLVMSAMAVCPAHAEPIFLGPTPYLSAADSPFDLSGLGETFFLEDFEDGELNTPGIRQVNTGPYGDESLAVVSPPSPFTDSVDADDGAIDGWGTGGHSLASRDLASTLSDPPIFIMTMDFEFDADVLGFYPNAVGFVWSDGMPTSEIGEGILTTGLGMTIFATDGSRSTMTWFGLGDQTRMGTTSDDHFFGAVDPAGIRRVYLSSSYWAVEDYEMRDLFFELDHLQYGVSAIPEPTSLILALFLTGTSIFYFFSSTTTKGDPNESEQTWTTYVGD